MDGQCACRSPPCAATTPPLGLELRLERVTVDGEPAVRVIVPGEQPAEGSTEELVEQALWKDPSTGLLLRHHFLEQIEARLQTPVAAGVRAVAYIRPDHFSRVHGDVGLLGTEALIMRLGRAAARTAAAERPLRPLRRHDLCGASSSAAP